ncbi:GIY-YIG nuclease family protein [Mycoplasma leonicaptivi]|uniref:GIY-YIG nuclease family protein n=1 Tax=Mycoplasma leonicaptivi TaxID=36742 RepID=UPI00055FC599|nr:GIY-YIG nuclease family protein [Mycoplasma leonicaptivi]
MKKDILFNQIENEIKDKPGVYLWKDKDKKIIYIGKAKKLKKRMKQYFKGSINSYKTNTMMLDIDSFEVFYTENEKDAFLLEENLIRQYQPKYNIDLIYSGGNPYIKIFINKNIIDFKKVERLPKKINKENEYFFGPLFKDDHHYAFIDCVKSIFLYKEGLPLWNLSDNEIRNIFQNIILAFKNKNNFFKKKLYLEEEKFCNLFDFNLAQKYKLAQEFLQNCKIPQVSELKRYQSIDFFEFDQEKNAYFVSYRKYRFGATSEFNNLYFFFDGLLEEFIENFLNKYYNNNEIPINIVLNNEINNLELNLNTKIQNLILYPKIGTFKKIQNNIKVNLIETKEKFLKDNKTRINLFTELEQKLNKTQLSKITIFDNSFESNQKGVGSYYTIYKYSNKVSKNKYSLEKYLINYSVNADIYYMYYNVLHYIKYNGVQENELFIADGWHMQIKEVKESLKNFNFINPVIGLVKDNKHKTKYVIDEFNNVIELSKESFNLLANMQVKVDNVAKTYFQKKQENKLFLTSFLNIKGIGQKTEQKLLDYFQTFENIKNATIEELEKVVSLKIAKLIFDTFSNNKNNKI